MKTIYLVLPCYNEEAVLHETSSRLKVKMNQLISENKISKDSRITFVDDGSKDNTWSIIEELKESDELFAGIKLSRNRGHQNALLAGLMTVKDYCDAAISLDADLQDDIKIIGLYRNKAKNLILMCNQLKNNFNGEVPKTMEGITSLAGAGRKTANVVLSNAFNVPSIAVDTHVFRVSNRLGLADSNNVLEVEKQLQKELPKKEWSLAHHLLIFHGRRCCIARKPKCEECPLAHLCKYKKELNHK